MSPNWEECGQCPVFCELYPGISLTTDEKARKNLNQGNRRVPVVVVVVVAAAAADDDDAAAAAADNPRVFYMPFQFNTA